MKTEKKKYCYDPILLSMKSWYGEGLSNIHYASHNLNIYLYIPIIYNTDLLEFYRNMKKYAPITVT